jgi:hypothetical protein
MEISSRQSEHGVWEMLSRDPHPLLTGQVLRYSGYVERAKLPVRRLEAPFAGIVLILSFGKKLWIRDARGEDSQHVSFVGGLSDKPTYTERRRRRDHQRAGEPGVRLTRLLGPRPGGQPLELWDLRLMGGAGGAGRNASVGELGLLNRLRGAALRGAVARGDCGGGFARGAVGLHSGRSGPRAGGQASHSGRRGCLASRLPAPRGLK